MPFSPDPSSFAGWLNNTNNWYDRSLQIQFQYLGECSYSYNYGAESYGCNVGYAYVKDAIGKKKCRVTVSYNGYDRQVGFRKYDCRELTVEERARDLYKEAKKWWHTQ